jgi:hypothetical protein
MKLVTFATTAIALALGACNKDGKQPASPPAEVAVPAAEAPVAPPVAPPPAAPVEEAPPAEGSVGALIGKPAKVEVRTLGSRKARAIGVSDAATVTAFAAAVGKDGKPTGALRRCRDTVQVAFYDDAGAERATIGACNTKAVTDATPLEGLQLSWQAEGSARSGGLEVADEPALRALIARTLATP